MRIVLCLSAALAMAFAPALPAFAQEEAAPAPAPAPAPADAEPAAPADAGLAPADSVSGTLTLDGEEVALTHGCTLRLDNEEGYMDGPELRILLADREVSADLLKSPDLSELGELVREGEVRFMLLRIGLSGEERVINGMALAASPEAPKPPAVFSLTADAGYSDLNLTEERVSAAITQTAKLPDPETPAAPSAPTCAFDVRFDTLIRPNDPITAHLTGEDAVNSPQAAAFMGYGDALRDADMEALKKVTSGDQAEQLGALIAQVGEEAFKQNVSQNIPDAETRKAQISEVFVRGARAMLMLTIDGQRAPLPLVQEGDVWKMK